MYRWEFDTIINSEDPHFLNIRCPLTPREMWATGSGSPGFAVKLMLQGKK